MNVVLVVLFALPLVAGYFVVGVLFGPSAYSVGRETCSITVGEYGANYARQRGDERGRAMQLATVFCWPLMMPYVLSHQRRLADEKAGPNPDGLTRKQRRDLAYQRALTEILEQQHRHAEAALAAQKRSMDLQDRSPLNLAGRTR